MKNATILWVRRIGKRGVFSQSQECGNDSKSNGVSRYYKKEKRMFLKSFISISIIVSSVIAEPSVYSKAITYTGSSSNSSSLYEIRQQISALREELDGLKSIVKSLSQRLRKTQTKDLSSYQNSNPEIELLKQRVSALEKAIKSITIAQTTTKTVANRVERPKINKIEASKRDSIQPHTKKLSLSSIPSYKLYKNGVILFSKKQYQEAKKKFEILLSRGYKKAAVNFYLGEIAYRTGRYRDAIKYYQASAELNENAAYMDKLLLHTGISLENDGNVAQAKKFYQAIVDAYPGTESARVAKKRLK